MPYSDRLLTPVILVVQAVNTQEANKAASNRLPPLWAMVAMVLLGWNEAMSILTSPVRLVQPLPPSVAPHPRHSCVWWHFSCLVISCSNLHGRPGFVSIAHSVWPEMQFQRVYCPDMTFLSGPGCIPRGSAGPQTCTVHRWCQQSTGTACFAGHCISM